MCWNSFRDSVDWMSVCRFVVSMSIVIGFFVMAIMVLYADSSDLGQAGMLIIGALIAAFSNVVGYYIGSSSGSAAKDKIMHGGPKL